VTREPAANQRLACRKTSSADSASATNRASARSADRRKFTISLVVALRSASHTTFGGAPRKKLRYWKSSSLLTITSPCRAA